LKAKGLTQAELAEKLGTAQYVITNYERGERRPSADMLPDIAKALEVPLGALYGMNGVGGPGREERVRNAAGGPAPEDFPRVAGLQAARRP